MATLAVIVRPRRAIMIRACGDSPDFAVDCARPFLSAADAASQSLPQLLTRALIPRNPRKTVPPKDLLSFHDLASARLQELLIVSCLHRQFEMSLLRIYGEYVLRQGWDLQISL